MPTTFSHTLDLDTPTPVAVLGAGPAGAATVLALLQKHLPVLWLVRPAVKASAVGEHLAPEARPAIIRLGLSHILESSAHLPCPGIVSHWGGEAYERDYLFSPFGSGWNLDRTRFDRDLIDEARRRGAKILKIRSVESIRRSSSQWRASAMTSDGRRCPIAASFLVDATGRNAVLARRLGSQPHRHDRLVGLFADLPARPPGRSEPDARLLIEPLADGWWYSLRLRSDRLIAVFLTDADRLRSGIRASKRLWHERFSASKATQVRAAMDAEPGTFRIAPAHTQVSPEMFGDGWLAVGDACMAFDPLSASGITKALGDGISAADAIASYLDGRRGPLDRYARSRRAAFVRYLKGRQELYRQETRWPRSEFWHRRYADSARN